MWWFLPCILGFIRLYLDGVKVLLYQLFNKSFTLPDLPKQNGKVAIVTGGTRGMGYEISRHLVSLDMHVIIAGNKEEEGLAAVKKIQELNQGKAKRDHFSCYVWTGVFTGRMCESKQKNTNREMFDDCVR